MPCQQVSSLQTGHSPFLASPEDLAAVLVSIAETYRD